jgi:hypothetical protein
LLYEQEILNYFVMYSLCLSFCRFRTFRPVEVLNMIQWTILSDKIWNCYYTSGVNGACKPVAQPIVLEGLNYKRKFMEISNSHILWLYVQFCLFFLILIWTTVGQILNASWHYVVIWCVPSATCGSWLCQSHKIFMSTGVFVGLILTLYVTPPPRVLSTALPKCSVASVLPFI